ncbi:MAG TPA: anaerobic ribonucleoside-triphosphate reductase activating protein [Syntrophomonadaceae bacterium]|nr:anaerobic ribonucleoside-triphosphate reductase activating protein [Syntrophomonadaceae bacterium]
MIIKFPEVAATMRFAGLIKQSLIDYPDEMAAVLFTRGCNFACPFCHNGHLLYKPGRKTGPDLGMDEVLDFLRERKGFLDAVVFSGGEPTQDRELVQAIHVIKRLGYLVKLDTNGSNPDILAELLNGKQLDYVAMDVKAPLEFKKYQAACGGRLRPQDFLSVRNSIHLLSESSIKVEFRTTVVPALHSPDDLVDIARSLEGAHLFTLQQFQPENALDPALTTVQPYTQGQLEEMAQACAPYVQKVRVVNL